jgi:hypothetical protein
MNQHPVTMTNLLNLTHTTAIVPAEVLEARRLPRLEQFLKEPLPLIPDSGLIRAIA